MTERLIAHLVAMGLDPDHIADALLLLHRRSSVLRTPGHVNVFPEQLPPADAEGRQGTVNFPSDESAQEPVQEAVQEREGIAPESPVRRSKAPVHLRTGPIEEVKPLLSASPVALPSAEPLRRELALPRALRPFRWVREPGRELILDIETSVTETADLGRLVTVSRPRLVRTLDVALIVDDGASVRGVWDETFRVFERVLIQVGAFRSVTRWRLAADARGVYLVDGLGGRHLPSRLADPSGRRLVLVATDAVGDPWFGPAVWQALDDWAAQMPTTLVHLLPERYWPATATGRPISSGRASRPALPNRLLTIAAPDWYRADLPCGTAFLPVVSLTPPAMAGWASAIVAGTDWTHAVAIQQPKAATGPGSVNAALPLEERVDSFLSRASHGAQRLAHILSSAPLLSPELAHILQARLAPETGVTELAEVFVSGLLQEAAHGHFRFLPDAVALLQRGLTITEEWDTFQAATEYLASRPAPTGTASALVPSPDGLGRIPITDLPFAVLQRTLSERFSAAAAHEVEDASPLFEGTLSIGFSLVSRPDFIPNPVLMEKIDAALDSPGHRATLRADGERAGAAHAAAYLREKTGEDGKVLLWLDASTRETFLYGVRYFLSSDQVHRITAGTGDLLATTADWLTGNMPERHIVVIANAAPAGDVPWMDLARRLEPVRILALQADDVDLDFGVAVDVGPAADSGSLAPIITLGSRVPIRAFDVFALSWQLFIATYDSNGALRIWSTETGLPLRHSPLAFGDMVGIVAFNEAQNQPLIAIHGPNAVAVVDPSTNPMQVVRTGVARIELMCAMRAESGDILVMADASGRVRFEDPRLGHAVIPPLATGQTVLSLAEYTSGDRSAYLAVGCANGQTLFWDPTDPEIGTLHAASGAVTALCTVETPDGRTLLATGFADGGVQLWHPVQGRPAFRLDGSGGAVRSLCVVSGRDEPVLLAVGSDDGRIRIWDLDARANLMTLGGHAGPATTLRPLPPAEGSLLLVSGGADGAVKIWRFAQDSDRLDEWRRLDRIHSGPVLGIAIGTTPEGFMIVFSIDNETLLMTDLSGTVMPGADAGGLTTITAVGPMVVTGDRRGVTSEWLLERTEWGALALEPGRRQERLLSESAITALASCPLHGDVPLFVSGHEDGTITVREYGSEDRRLGAAPTAITALEAFRLHDRMVVVSGHRDGTIFVWNPGAETRPRHLRAFASQVTSLSFGSYLVASEEKAGPPIHVDLLLAADLAGERSFWDPMAWTELIFPLPVYSGPQHALASVEGQPVIVFDEDDTVLAYNLFTEAIGAPLARWSYSIRSDTTSDKVRAIATGSDHGRPLAVIGDDTGGLAIARLRSHYRHPIHSADPPRTPSSGTVGRLLRRFRRSSS